MRVYVHLRPASRARRRLASNRRMVSRGIARICQRGADDHPVHLGAEPAKKADVKSWATALIYSVALSERHMKRVSAPSNDGSCEPSTLAEANGSRIDRDGALGG